MARLRLRDELINGRRTFRACLKRGLSSRFKPGELLATPGSPPGALYRLRSGWACQFQDRPDGHRAILDVYLPGDILGLDALLNTRPVEGTLTLTSGIVEATNADDSLANMLLHLDTALYITWLLSQRQRRADRLIAMLNGLDARGRVAMMIWDFYKRLLAHRLITAPIFHLPLTQTQIGSYLGLTVVHVNRVLRALREDLVVSVDKHCVTILDLDALGRVAQTSAPESAARQDPAVIPEAGSPSAVLAA